MNQLNLIKKRLHKIYNPNDASKCFNELQTILLGFQNKCRTIQKNKKFSEKDTILICYADNIKYDDECPLKTLNRFLNKYLKSYINTIHLLPFFPYSSDDGFAVIDFYKVNPEFGNWSDIENLNSNFNLMFDLVLNHVSSKNKWFQKFLNHNPKYENYFIELPKDSDITSVVRPRTSPLLTEFDNRYIWTTFSADQVDLNYSNYKVLIEMIQIFLFFILKGMNIIRLDAIAYIWKELHTPCIHLPQTHEIVKLFRDIIDYLNINVKILTETNVPHKENITYFGNGYDEAHIIYQFSLPILLAHSILKNNSHYITNWADSLTFFDNTAYFNFTASHDGVGVTPAKRLIPDEDINFLVDTTKKHNGYVSYKTIKDDKIPYELNINYLNLISKPNDPITLKKQKLLLSQAVMLSLKGIPGIYIHSLLGSENYIEGVKKSGKNRTINREKLQLKELESQLADKNSLTYNIFFKYLNLIKIRIKQKCFSPYAKQNVININQYLFVYERISEDNKEKILVINNISNKNISINYKITDSNKNFCIDLITRKRFFIENNLIDIKIKPYNFFWIKID